MEIFAIMNDFIKTELLILTPVLYVIVHYLTDSRVKNEYIPWILLCISVALSGLYIFATNPIGTFSQVLMAIFTTIVQGILLSSTAIYGGILNNVTRKIYQDRRKKDDTLNF